MHIISNGCVQVEMHLSLLSTSGSCGKDACMTFVILNQSLTGMAISSCHVAWVINASGNPSLSDWAALWGPFKNPDFSWLLPPSLSCFFPLYFTILLLIACMYITISSTSYAQQKSSELSESTSMTSPLTLPLCIGGQFCLAWEGTMKFALVHL